jgi:hypothetical protein
MRAWFPEKLYESGASKPRSGCLKAGGALRRLRIGRWHGRRRPRQSFVGTVERRGSPPGPGRCRKARQQAATEAAKSSRGPPATAGSMSVPGRSADVVTLGRVPGVRVTPDVSSTS